LLRKHDSPFFPGTHTTAETLRNVADKIDAIIGYSEPAITYSRPKRALTTKSNLADILL